MFKNCCGCGKLKKVSDSSGEVEKERDDNKDKTVVDKGDEKKLEEGKKDKPDQEKQSDDVQEKKTEIVSSAAKNPGLVVDTTSSVAITKEDDDDDEDDNEVFPVTPRTANMATPHPSKRNSTPGLASIPRWLSQEDDDDPTPEGGGTAEPPVTPVGRDELALRRHRFFSDLLVAAQAATEHRVRFDPLGPSIAGPCDCGSSPVVELNTILSRLESITSRLEKTVPTPDKQNTAIQVSLSPEHKPIAMSVAAYSDIIRGPLTSYLTLSGKIGGDVASHAKLVGEAFQAQVQYLQLAASRGAPGQEEEMKLLQPTSQKIQAIQKLREENRASQNFNHLSAISESIPALGWVTVSPAPAPYVKEMNDAGQFYTNRVLKEWKQKDQTHVEWVKAWVETLTELQKFVKQHHTTGLVWSGGKSGGGAPPPPPPGCPPPPPVLPPIGDLGLNDSSDDRSALFAEINQGENITKNLKKVTSEMQTHKNPSLRTGPAPFKAPPSTGAPPTTAVKPPGNKPPVFAKDGKKWLIEYQHKNQNLVVDGAEMNNVVYMYGCTESTLTVKGKINSVFLDSCKKSAVVFDSLVSSVEFVNCQSVQMQVLGKVPTISIDKTDGCQIYLSKDSLDVEIISSKSSEMNVLVPKANGDFAEFPVPEQFKTTVKPTGLTTIAVESKG